MAGGMLYGIGVGPGDPELLTLKAVRVLRKVAAVAVPVSREDGESYALTTVSTWLQPEQRVLRLHFPMTRDVATRERHRRAAARAIAAESYAGRDVAFLTEGDPLIHSTFIYVLRRLPENLPVEIVPGVSQRLAVVPATSESLTGLRRILGDFDTVVLIKIHRTLDRLIDLLDEMGLVEQAVLVERASHSSGRVVRDLRDLRGQPVHYLSLLIVHTPSIDGDGLRRQG